MASSYQIVNKMYINENATIKDKVVIVTGSNTGLGKAIALELAKRGGKIYFACRSEEKTMEAINEIKTATNSENLHFLKLDLGSLQSVREFSQKFHEIESRLDILINNAGVLSPLERTADGFEMNFGVNHLGHFLLTNLLLDLLKASTPSRIIVIASAAHKLASLKKDDINSENSFGGTWKGYGHSKLCNILFMRELSKRLEGTGVVCNAICPGAVNTEATRYLSPFVNFFFRPMMKYFYKTPEIGCQPIVMLAVEPSLAETTGNYYSQYKIEEPKVPGPEDQLWLWDKSVELTKNQNK